MATCIKPNKPTVAYSIVVPLYNEAPVVETLYQRIVRAMGRLGEPFEMIFVDDGSRDGTVQTLEALVAEDDRAVLIELRRNFGQATALQAGFDRATGDVIVAMDGDLQHDPHEIPLFVSKLDEAVTCGSILSICDSLDAPLSYVTIGQDVPDDIAVADAGHLARCIVGEPPDAA